MISRLNQQTLVFEWLLTIYFSTPPSQPRTARLRRSPMVKRPCNENFRSSLVTVHVYKGRGLGSNVPMAADSISFGEMEYIFELFEFFLLAVSIQYPSNSDVFPEVDYESFSSHCAEIFGVRSFVFCSILALNRDL